MRKKASELGTPTVNRVELPEAPQPEITVEPQETPQPENVGGPKIKIARFTGKKFIGFRDDMGKWGFIIYYVVIIPCCMLLVFIGRDFFLTEESDDTVMVVWYIIYFICELFPILHILAGICNLLNESLTSSNKLSTKFKYAFAAFGYYILFFLMMSIDWKNTFPTLSIIGMFVLMYLFSNIYEKGKRRR